MIYYLTTGIFPTGQLLATPSARQILSHDEILAAVHRHINGDWGDLCPEDKQQNNQALKYGDRLFSAYRTTDGEKFWIITEADRSATTVLLPEEY